MKLWIVGKHVHEGPWEFQGVFSTQQEAEDVALGVRDGLCFVGPCVLNEHVGDKSQSWPDSYFPFPKGST